MFRPLQHFDSSCSCEFVEKMTVKPKSGLRFWRARMRQVKNTFEQSFRHLEILNCTYSELGRSVGMRKSHLLFIREHQLCQFTLTTIYKLFKVSLMIVFLHNGNKIPSVSVAHVTNQKQLYDNIQLLPEKIKYYMHVWKICGDLKVIFIYLLFQLPVCVCVCVCDWGSRDRKKY